jgi:hypothetical protein
MQGRQAGGKRIFDRAFADVEASRRQGRQGRQGRQAGGKRSTSAPGSASASEVDVLPPSAGEYKGGRRNKMRYAYKEDSRAAFIELSPDHRMTVEQFRSYHFRQMDMSSL